MYIFCLSCLIRLGILIWKRYIYNCMSCVCFLSITVKSIIRLRFTEMRTICWACYPFLTLALDKILLQRVQLRCDTKEVNFVENFSKNLGTALFLSKTKCSLYYASFILEVIILTSRKKNENESQYSLI